MTALLIIAIFSAACAFAIFGFLIFSSILQISIFLLKLDSRKKMGKNMDFGNWDGSAWLDFPESPSTMSSEESREINELVRRAEVKRYIENRDRFLEKNYPAILLYGRVMKNDPKLSFGKARVLFSEEQPVRWGYIAEEYDELLEIKENKDHVVFFHLPLAEKFKMFFGHMFTNHYDFPKRKFRNGRFLDEIPGYEPLSLIDIIPGYVSVEQMKNLYKKSGIQSTIEDPKPKFVAYTFPPAYTIIPPNPILEDAQTTPCSVLSEIKWTLPKQSEGIKWTLTNQSKEFILI